MHKQDQRKEFKKFYTAEYISAAPYDDSLAELVLPSQLVFAKVRRNNELCFYEINMQKYCIYK